MAIVTPQPETPREDLPQSAPASSTNPPTTPPVSPTTASSNNPPTPTTTSSTNPTTPSTTASSIIPATPSTTLSTTPNPSPRKRKKNANQQILDFLKTESVNEQRRHTESEDKTERFINFFERFVDKMPDK
ncbi:unnamed protein product [Knipowitschia caucasica]